MNGDKSITHRAFMIGSLSRGRTTIKGFSTCEDCTRTLRIMKNLGVNINHESPEISIEGNGIFNLSEPDSVLDCGNSATTMRLITGILAGQKFNSVLTGDSSLRKRPMDRIIKPLQKMNACIQAENQNKYAPLKITGRPLSAIEYKLPVASAQVKSSILLAGLHSNGTTKIIEPAPSRDHTEIMLDYLGWPIEKRERKIILKNNGKLKARNINIPGDISSASYLLALASMLPESNLCIKEVGINPTRTGFLNVLEKMNVNFSLSSKRIVSGERVADINVEGSKMKGVKIGGKLIPRLIDEIPVIAVLATKAEGVTEVSDASELRVKETDRIKAIVTELRKMGAEIEEKRDGFIINGPVKLNGAECESYRDHRIAMSLCIAGLTARGTTTVNEAECIKTSFPEFIKVTGEICGENVIEKLD